MLKVDLPACGECGNPTATGSRGPVRRFCDRCRKSRAAARRRIKEGVRVQIGGDILCTDCGAVFQYVRGIQTQCPPCRRQARRIEDRDSRRRLRVESPAYRINDTLKVQIRQSLRGTKGGRAWEALVGYTLADLMLHLERQFTTGMTFLNHGTWHIDHIVPLASFDIASADCPGFKAAWALTNLRPLWATDNVRKSAKRTHLI